MIYAASFCIYWRFSLQTIKKKEPWQKQENLLKSLGSFCVFSCHGAFFQTEQVGDVDTLLVLRGGNAWVGDLGVWFGVFCFHRALKKLKGGILVVAFLLKFFFDGLFIFIVGLKYEDIWRNIYVLNFTQACDMVWRKNPSDAFFYFGWCFSEHHM